MRDVAPRPPAIPNDAPIPVCELDLRRHPLTAEVERRLKTSCAVAPDASILVGVSGGSDSVALLLACHVLHRRGGLGSVQVVHVHHHLRTAADDDAAFVTALCARLDVPLHLRHVYPGDVAGNTAHSARTLRYDALGQIAAETQSNAVAVAHHADDQLETMLMTLCRGAGIDGLAGMPWRRALAPSAPGVDLVRPLLAVRVYECHAYCRLAGVDWREDEYNHDPAQVRARLRRDVTPVLEELWPDAARRAASTADTLAAARDALDTLIEARFGSPSRRSWPRSELADLPPTVVAAGLRRAAVHAVPTLADSLGRRVLDPAAAAIVGADLAPKRFTWPSAITLVVTSKTVSLDLPPATLHESEPPC